MKKYLKLALFVSVLMIAGFIAFIIIMGKNSKNIKNVQKNLSNQEIGVTELQSEQKYKSFNTQTVIDELIISGDNVNVVLFDNSEPKKIYDTKISADIHEQLARMEDKRIILLIIRCWHTIRTEPTPAVCTFILKLLLTVT